MSRGPRTLTEKGCYHVVQKGAGGQQIFEDAEDRLYYLNLLNRSFQRHHMRLLAWCLMDNHTHLLLDDPDANVSEAFQRLGTGYAMFFKGKTGLEGPVFKGRFYSKPIEDDNQLLQAMRYIHDNPVKGGRASLLEYRWSSFHEYMTEPQITDTSTINALLGSTASFYRFSTSGLPNAYYIKTGRSISEQDYREVAEAALYPLRCVQVKSLEKPPRNEALIKLADIGLSLKQIELVTGIPRSTVFKIIKKGRN